MDRKPLTRAQVLRRYKQGDIDFTYADLTEVDLHGAVLSGAAFSYSRLRDANFAGATLVNTIFDHCNLQSARFSHANLSGASFNFALLDFADFSHADLSYTNFWGSYLADTTLQDALLPTASRDLISYVLETSAGNKPERLMVAGLIKVQRSWCWPQFYECLKTMLAPEDQQWVRDAIAPYLSLVRHLKLTERGLPDLDTNDIPF